MTILFKAVQKEKKKELLHLILTMNAHINRLVLKNPETWDLKISHVTYAKIDLARKTRCLIGGHLSNAPATITSLSVVNKDSMLKGPFYIYQQP